MDKIQGEKENKKVEGIVNTTNSEQKNKEVDVKNSSKDKTSDSEVNKDNTNNTQNNSNTENQTSDISGEPKVTKYIQDSNTNYDYIFKVALIGDSGTGKTTILVRYSDGIFKDNTQSTIGVDFKIVSLNINNTTIKLQIWDTCGSERFKSITGSFIKSCNAYILVFDITSLKSFQNLENWVKLINDTTVANFYCLVGNKSDLKDQRQVTQQDAIKFASKYSLQYIETSAKENENIEKVFNHVTFTLHSEIKKKRDSIKASENNVNNYLGQSRVIGLNMPEDDKPLKSEGCGC